MEFKKSVTDDVVNASTYVNESETKEEYASFTEESESTRIMEIEDVFHIAGRGVVVTGVIEDSAVSVHENVVVNGKTYVVSGIEHYKKLIETATKDMGVGILFNGAVKNEFKRGDIIFKNN